MLEVVAGMGLLGLGFLITIALVRLALAVADFLDRHNGPPPPPP